MARVVETTDVSRNVIRDAVAWYAENSVPRALRGVDPSVLAVVKDLCGGDWRRCFTDDGRSVVVCRNRQWTPRASE